MRGLSRLLRRNPSDAERLLWTAITKDRRFAGAGFKRQVPVGPHILDMVSFPLRIVIDIDPRQESAKAAEARAGRQRWLEERNYAVVALTAADIEADIGKVLDDLARRLQR